MTFAITRRLLLAAPLCGAAAPIPTEAAPFAALEARHGGRIGVAGLDTGTGRRLSYRAGERFALCSTHKLLTVAAVLSRVDAGALQLGQHIAYGPPDLLDYAPITRKHVGDGFMTLADLCAAAIDWSDNTAANLLLAVIGGPAGWTRYARAIGDTQSRLDRTEPALNSAIPGDPRDTTTPEAMLGALGTILLGDALRSDSRGLLQDWLLASRITDSLLRAGLPAGWRVGDKSGSGDNATRNDIGIILPPNAAPILACVYTTAAATPPPARDAVISEIGRIIATGFAR